MNIKAIIFGNAFLLLLITVLFGGGFYYVNNYLTDLSESKKITQAVSNIPIPKSKVVQTPQETLAYLESNALIHFPKELKKEVLSPSKLPESIKSLIPVEARDVKVFSKTFEGGSKGFEVVFAYPNTLEYSYTYFRNITSAGFDLLDGRKSDRAALLIVENTAYLFRGGLVQNEATTTVVTLAVQAK